ncbi:MAG: serine/threonine-protein kinase [Pseudomonadota bacterium]
MSSTLAQKDPWFLDPGSVVIDNFTIEESIGRGGMSEVYRARNHTGKSVALKILRPECVTQADLNVLLHQEAELRKINHAAVVDYLICQQAEHRGQTFIFIVMDYVGGPTLKSLSQEIGPVPADVLLKLARRIGQGLVAVHERRIFHRDISPDNIVLRGSDPCEAVLIDFGIALNEGASGPSVIGDRFAGKQRYAAPEQFEGRVSGKSDLYSLGLTLLAAARGDPRAVDERDAEGRPITEGLEPRLAYVIERLTGPKPQDRLPSAYGLTHVFDTEKYLRMPAPPVVDLRQPAAMPTEHQPDAAAADEFTEISVPPGPLFATSSLPGASAAAEVAPHVEPLRYESGPAQDLAPEPRPRPSAALIARLEESQRLRVVRRRQRTLFVAGSLLVAYGIGLATAFVFATAILPPA